MSAVLIILAMFLLIPGIHLHAQTESFRTVVEASIEVSSERNAENPVSIGTNNSILINLGGEARFLRGIEIEVTAPQAWLQYRGALAMTMYNNLNPQTASGLSDMAGNRIASEPMPSRLRMIYHIPIRSQHGLRNTTTVTLASRVIQPASFPLIFKLTQIAKGLPDDFDQLRFTITARPILSDEGAVRLVTRFPPQLRNRPFTVLINDNVISNISEQIFLREGENHLVVISDDYRNISHRFVVEKARVTEIIIDLQDPAPVILFEAPQNAQIFLNNNQVRSRENISVEPGVHEVRFQVGDYTITRTLNVQRGKTYRVALAVDLTIQEED